MMVVAYQQENDNQIHLCVTEKQYAELSGRSPVSLSDFEVILALCSAVLSCPGLQWNRPIDSLELFAGECSISSGEFRDWVGEKLGENYK